MKEKTEELEQHFFFDGLFEDVSIARNNKTRCQVDWIVRSEFLKKKCSAQRQLSWR